jgi:hypothetical protein
LRNTGILRSGEPRPLRQSTGRSKRGVKTASEYYPKSPGYSRTNRPLLKIIPGSVDRDPSSLRTQQLSGTGHFKSKPIMVRAARGGRGRVPGAAAAAIIVKSLQRFCEAALRIFCGSEISKRFLGLRCSARFFGSHAIFGLNFSRWPMVSQSSIVHSNVNPVWDSGENSLSRSYRRSTI